MFVRKLTGADYDSFLAMRINMLETSSENYSAGANDWKTASKQQIMAYLLEGEKEAGNFVLGAFQPDLVGMVGFRRETRESVRHKGSIWGLFQKPEGETSAMEEALLKEVVKIVKSYEGFEYIRTVQNATNHTKMKLFLSLGFVQYGLEERSLRVGDCFFDQAYLKLIV